MPSGAVTRILHSKSSATIYGTPSVWPIHSMRGALLAPPTDTVSVALDERPASSTAVILYV